MVCSPSGEHTKAALVAGLVLNSAAPGIPCGLCGTVWPHVAAAMLKRVCPWTCLAGDDGRALLCS